MILLFLPLTLGFLRNGDTIIAQAGLDLKNHTLKGLRAPVAPDEAASKGYVDSSTADSPEIQRKLDDIISTLLDPIDPTSSFLNCPSTMEAGVPTPCFLETRTETGLLAGTIQDETRFSIFFGQTFSPASFMQKGRFNFTVDPGTEAFQTIHINASYRGWPIDPITTLTEPGPISLASMACSEVSCVIQAEDALGNLATPISVSGTGFLATMSVSWNASTFPIPVIYSSPGLWSAELSPIFQLGTYSLQILYDGVEIMNSPHSYETTNKLPYCPAGWTLLNSSSSSWGARKCISPLQSAQTPWAAQDYCFSTFGGRLPAVDEILQARALGLPAPSTSYELEKDGEHRGGSANSHVVVNQAATQINSVDDTNGYEFRCVLELRTLSYAYPCPPGWISLKGPPGVVDPVSTTLGCVMADLQDVVGTGGLVPAVDQCWSIYGGLLPDTSVIRSAWLLGATVTGYELASRGDSRGGGNQGQSRVDASAQASASENVGNNEPYRCFTTASNPNLGKKSCPVGATELVHANGNSLGCIENAVRPASLALAAWGTCGSLGARLPTLSELRIAHTEFGIASGGYELVNYGDKYQTATAVNTRASGYFQADTGLVTQRKETSTGPFRCFYPMEWE